VHLVGFHYKENYYADFISDSSVGWLWTALAPVFGGVWGVLKDIQGVS
jgi:hypothetical protein